MCWGLLAFLRFESPGYLALLAVIPLLVVLSFRSLAGLGRGRRWLAIVMRSLVVTAMVLALSGAQWVKTNDDLSVIFAVDRSNSVPREWQQKSFAFIKQAQEGRHSDDRMGVIAFDARSAIEQLPMSALAIERITEPIGPDETDLAAAMRLGMALFPPQTARRLVLITDGNENSGDVLEEANQFRAAGVPVDIVPIRYRHENEIIFERLTAPPTASAEETINLQMVLRSEKPAAGRILLYHGDQLVPLGAGGDAGYRVKLEPGPNRFTVPVPLRFAGVHRFRAVFEPDSTAADTIVANNEGRAFTVVAGQGRILIVTTESDLPSARFLAKALESEKLVCDVEVAGTKPLDQVRLLEYSLVILSNVPANFISEEDQTGLSIYVRDLGGGLIMVGGDEAFGAGGWMGSPVEEIMPVSFDVKSKKQIPKGALALVMHASEIPEGNFWGERVAVAAVKTLSSRDLVGVLSFQWQGNKQQDWVVPLQTVGNKTAIIQEIMKMQMGDMPSLQDILGEAVDALVPRKDAAAKHVIVISDFDPTGPDQALLDRMVRERISCSTVAIGYGSHPIDERKAKWIADTTKGKFYATKNYSELPQIFIKESRIVRRSLINESPFTPRLVSALAPTVAGLAGDGIPQLFGYVLTTAKPLADVPLIRKTEEEDDPILAQWQVGLGKTVAFTSGMWPRWGVDWAEWQKFSKLWAQIARWASRQAESAAFDVSTSVQGGRGKIRIDALDKNAGAINFMTVEGTIVTPKQQPLPLRLSQTGPGRYEGEFEARDPGSYVLSLAYRSGAAGGATGSLQTGLSVAYSPEYRELEANLPLLKAIVDRTNGRLLDSNKMSTVFDRGNLPKAEARTSIWEDLVRWMLLLFLLDVAVRRIAVHPVQMARRLRRFIAELAGSRKAGEGSQAVLSTLKGTRGQVRETLKGSAADEGGAAPPPTTRYEAGGDARSTEELAKALGGASESDKPVVAKPTRKPTPTSEADYLSRLRQAKRKARDTLDEEGKQGDE